MDRLVVTYGNDNVIDANKLVILYSYMEPGIHGDNSDMHAYFNIEDAPDNTIQFLQKFPEDRPTNDEASSHWIYLRDPNSGFSYLGHRYKDRIYLSGDHCDVKSVSANVSVSLRNWRQFKLMGSSLDLFPQLISTTIYAKGKKVSLTQLQKLWNYNEPIGIFKNKLQTLLRSVDSKFIIEGKKHKAMLVNAMINIL